MASAGRVLPVLFASFWMAMPCSSPAQETQMQRQVERERQAQIEAQRPALSETALIDYGVYLQATYFSLQDAQADNHILRELDGIAYARLGIGRHQQVFFRARGSILDFDSGDSFNGDDHDSQARLERLFYAFEWHSDESFGGSQKPLSLSVQVGRQFVYWGQGLTLGATLDGAVAEVNAGPVGLNFLAGVTAPWTIDFDTSRPDYNSHTRRGWYGAMASVYIERHRIYAYGLLQEDMNNNDALHTGDITTQLGYDSRYLGVGAEGAVGDRLSYHSEFVLERGSGLSNSFKVLQTPSGPALVGVPQTDESIDAWAGTLRLDYLPPGPRRVRLTAELVLASGDPDRQHTSNTFGGNASGTDDRAFNALGAFNTGLVFAPTISNVMIGHAGVSAFPLGTGSARGSLSRLQCGADMYVFFKQDRGAPVEDFTTSGRYLGWETDLFINWAIMEDLSIFVRYGIFAPSDVFPIDDLRQAWYVGVVYAF